MMPRPHRVNARDIWTHRAEGDSVSDADARVFLTKAQLCSMLKHALDWVQSANDCDVFAVEAEVSLYDLTRPAGDQERDWKVSTWADELSVIGPEEALAFIEDLRAAIERKSEGRMAKADQIRANIRLLKATGDRLDEVLRPSGVEVGPIGSADACEWCGSPGCRSDCLPRSIPEEMTSLGSLVRSPKRRATE